MFNTVFRIIITWLLEDIIKKCWNGILNVWIKYQADREKKVLEKAIEDLKKAQTLEERRKAQDDVANNSF